ncbi:MAG: glycosyltransferase [Bacteroidetes bacterium]|nr:glycosyltransferase [Bacteroidota bacterium]
MKILQLCLRIPFPPADGGTIAMYNMARSLDKAGASVTMLSFNTRKHFIAPEKLSPEIREKFRVQGVFLDATVKAVPAILNFFNNKSYNISRFDTPAFHHALEDLLQKEKFDVVQMESLFMTPYLNTIRKYSNAKVVLRAHNVEYMIWQRLASAAGNPLKKWYLNFLAGRLKTYENAILNELDAIIVLTEDDRKLFESTGATIPLLVSPIGLDTEHYKVTNNTSRELHFFHLGSMDWLPNIEAVNWFLEHCFPVIKKEFPKVIFHFAGKSMPDSIFKQASEQLKVYGRIDDARTFMSDKSVMLVPLLSGGGMRVKIIEGLAMGKTIISTAIGAEGIKYTENVNMLIGNTPEEFIARIRECIADPSMAHAIGKAARELAVTKYENSVLGKEVISFFNHTILKEN